MNEVRNFAMLQDMTKQEAQLREIFTQIQEGVIIVPKSLVDFSSVAYESHDI